MRAAARARNILLGSDKVSLSRTTRGIATLLAVPLAIFQVWLSLYANVPPNALGVAFLIPLFIIALLTTSGVTGKKEIGRWEIILATLTALSGIYLLFQSERLAGWILGLSQFTTVDMIAGSILIFVTFILMKRCVGPGITLVVSVLFVYTLMGHLLPGLLYHREFGISEIVEQAVISVNGGLFGTPISAAATYVYLFVVFGKLLEVSGGGQFFFKLAALLTGSRPGGVAKVSVISSGLFGMISGSPTADIMTTGSVTVPMMKKAGYRARTAAAIEAVSSIGGSLLPPVMGAVVFILIEFTGLPYAEVIESSLVVALLYYLAIYFQVHNYSVRDGLGHLPDGASGGFRAVLLTGWPYIVPLTVLVYLIEAGWTPQRSVTVATGLTILLSWFNVERDFRIDGAKLIKAVVTATVMMAPLVAAVAGAGLVELSLNVTGLASKISQQIYIASSGYPVLVLIFSALITIVFGMGMPTPAVYALAAVLLAPALVQSGFGVLQSHMFLVWFSIASHITPPVAIAAYVASTIASAPPAQVSYSCVRLGFLAFLLPFVFAFRPGLMLDGTLLTICVDIVVTGVSVYILAGAFAGYVTAPLSAPFRWFLIVLAMIALFAWPFPVLSVGTAVAGLAAIFVNNAYHKNARSNDNNR